MVEAGRRIAVGSSSQVLGDALCRCRRSWYAQWGRGEQTSGVSRCPKRLNDRIHARQRALDCALIKRIAIQFLKLGIAQAYCAR